MNSTKQRSSSRRGRLSRGSEFQRVYRQGRSRANRYLVVYSFSRPDGADAGELSADGADASRLGVSVGRKVGNAVVRNKVKRSIRAAFDHLDPKPPGGLDYVVLSRPDVAELIEREGMSGVQAALRDLIEESAPSE